MSLGQYVRPRLVVLGPNAFAFEAARAIENNNIGAVVVQERGRVVGIVTDRDLAVRLVARGLDPNRTRIKEVMASPVATLSTSDTRADAIRLMRELNVRRIPLVDDERLVGMVTLDDLLIDEAAPIDELAQVVAAQIGDGGPSTPWRRLAAARRAGRAASTYGRFLGHLRAAASLGAGQAETALEIVLPSIVRRLTPEEAKNLIAQLPSVVQPSLRALPPGPDKRITLERIVKELVQRMDVEPERAHEIVGAVGSTVAAFVSSGQIADVQAQLPRSMGHVFGHPAPKARAPARERARTR